MSLDNLLAVLEAEPVTLVTDKIAQAVTPSTKQTLHCTAVTPVTAEYREAYEERAAMMEYDGELPRIEAEYRTKREVFYSYAAKHHPQILTAFEAEIATPLEAME